MDFVLVGVVIAITSSFLLVLRRELHQFARVRGVPTASRVDKA